MFIRLHRLNGDEIAVAEEAIDWVEPHENKVEPGLKTDLYIHGVAYSVRETFQEVMHLLEPDPDF